ncbi:XPA protein C-terminus-domain-containing protein [Neurospora hispaniola]|uniref:DNA repair protein RAD14 n=1 Tax=Neurospora hispaniola TaxID=588809 RepID=A0AAJ0I6I1_9PEZI|nr:XPA protein C-terminus-domain-containing protein [Neurospora hispaniola]
MERASTPPAQARRSTRSTTAARPPSPPTPAADRRRIEESRLRVKDLRTQREADHRAAGIPLPSDSLPRTASGIAATDDIQLAGAAGRAAAAAASRKRPFTSISRNDVPASNRDARTATGTNDRKDGNNGNGNGDAGGSLPPISRKFTKFVDYNFSAMTDTKGGFLSLEDDPFNKHLSGPSKPGQLSEQQEQKPAHMTAAEWERMQLIRKLQRTKAGPYEPGLSVLTDNKEMKKCRECGSLEIDFVWAETFGCAVCGKCKERWPEKYSLLTKTEAKEDYLLTDPELKDPELLPHLSKPNPHKSHWHDMMLFLRYQVEEYAFNVKWGSAEALDAEFEKREQDKKRRKEAKFKEKLLDLKRKTRTEAFRRNTGKLGGIAGGDGGGDGTSTGRRGKATKFGDTINNGGKHVHEWGRTVENEEGMTVKTCTTCGMEVEELEF